MTREMSSKILLLDDDEDVDGVRLPEFPSEVLVSEVLYPDWTEETIGGN